MTTRGSKQQETRATEALGGIRLLPATGAYSASAINATARRASTAKSHHQLQRPNELRPEDDSTLTPRVVVRRSRSTPSNQVTGDNDDNSHKNHKSHNNNNHTTTQQDAHVLNDCVRMLRVDSSACVRPGIVLFDPHDLETPAADRRRPFELQLAGDNQLEHDVGPSSNDPNDPNGPNDPHDPPIEESAAAKSERMRLKVIQEIWTTEQTYVRDIRTLHDSYIVPLEDNKHPVMEDAQIAVFFNNLRQLVMLNSKLLNDLTDVVERSGASASSSTVDLSASASSTTSTSSPIASTESIGAVFCRYAPLFKLYAGYAKDYEVVLTLLRNYPQHARLASFLDTCRARSGSPRDFESFLIMPIQRIPRYKMLLERVQEFTPVGHRDAKFIVDAVHGVRFAASLINETVRTQENLETVLQTQKQFVGQLSLVAPDRRFIKNGKLVKMSTKRQEEVMVHLFNDMLLYSDVLLTGGFKIRRVVHLRSKAVGVKCNLPSTYDALLETKRQTFTRDCGFLVTSLEKTFALFAVTPAARTEWVDALTDALRVAQRDAATNGSSSNDPSESPADAAALWVPDRSVGSCPICRAAFKLYFRRHHCRRCGAVVCGNCSGQRSILFVGDSAREERVCNACFKVLDVVKKAATHWLARVLEFRGVLRRKRWNKWTEHYYELKAGILKQYTLASRSGLKSCTDTLDLAGAIVIHRSDSRSQKHRFCFQISTTGIDGSDSDSETAVAPRDERDSSDILLTSSSNGGGGALFAKMSPLKHAVTRFGDVVRHRESASTMSCSSAADAGLASSNGPLNSSTGAAVVVAKTSAASTSSPFSDAHGWILCGATYQDERAWSKAIQRSADKALHRMRRSRVTESALPLAFDRSSASGSTILSGRHSETHGSSSTAFFSDEPAVKTEHRRLQILKEIIRSEESYVTCLGECIRIFVQPLLLRQLEGQKLYRRRQSKYKKSLLHPFGGTASGGFAAAASGAFAQRALSNSSLQNVSLLRRFHSNGNGSNGVNSSAAGVAALSASDSKPNSSSGASQTQKILLLDADMAIFFSSIDQICTLNQQLLEHLARHLQETMEQDDDDRVHRAGAIFNAYAPLFQLYTSYASRHESALNAIKSPQFASFLKEMPEEASVNRLHTYLNMPMERIPRYKMLLQELLQSTAPEHIDYAPLQTALNSVDLVAFKIQEIIARRENARKMDELSSKVGIDLRGRRFVRDGTLRKVCRSKVQKYYVVLLEDAIVYGRLGGSLQKKKFRRIDLWEVKVSDDTDSIPAVINSVAGIANSRAAFYFFSPHKSFILLADSEDEKLAWLASIREHIGRALRGGPTASRRASVRSELLLNEEEVASDYELESAFVIKNGWLNVTSAETLSASGSNRRPHRLWVSLTLQTIALSAAFKAAQPDESISIELCEVAPMRESTFFRLVFVHDETRGEKKTYVFEAQSQAEREEWLRALTHCITGIVKPTNALELRRLSVTNATLAPVFMFDKVSNVCTICYHPFAVYRPRHHCRLCGCLVCGTCSKRKWTLAYSSSKKPSRVCDSCARANAASVSESFESDTSSYVSSAIRERT